jgi:hypothetical protein
VYGKELPLAIADATADFKKSIEHQVKIAKSDLKEQIIPEYSKAQEGNVA